MKKSRTVLQAKRYGIHSCTGHTSLLIAIRTMVEEEISSLVVTDDRGYLIGLISRNDILRFYISHDNWASRLVQDHMQRDVPTVMPQTLLHDAAELVLSACGQQVVVVLPEGEDLRPVALLNDADLAYHLVKSG